jgi:hypothetical protein
MEASSQPLPSSVSINKVEEAQIVLPQQEQDPRGEKEIVAAAARGLLLFHPQLQHLKIDDRSNLVLHPNSPNDGGQDLQGLRSLQTLWISGL